MEAALRGAVEQWPDKHPDHPEVLLTSEDLPVHLGLPMKTYPQHCRLFQALYLQEGREFCLITLYQKSLPDDPQTSPAFNPDAAQDFTVRCCRQLILHLLRHCRQEFILLPCTLDMDKLTDDSLKEEVKKQRTRAARFYSGPIPLTHQAYKKLEQAVLILASEGSAITNQSTRGVVSVVEAGQDISDAMIEDGAHVVFDWDNTLKLYDSRTRQLSCRWPRDFLLHLKRDRGCRLYIISAIRPSALNLTTLLSEVDKLGLLDLFVEGDDDAGVGEDQVDSGQPTLDQASIPARAPARAVVRSEYAHSGNVIICGYDKAETFLKLSGFDSRKGEKVMFFDDEVVNIDNFSALVPTSSCFHCKVE